MGGLRLDISYALRSLRRQPAYVAAVVATLALGIGANTTMFSVVRGVLLKPLPHENGSRIVRLYQPNTESALTGLSPLEMADYRRAATTLSHVVEYHSMPFTFLGNDEPQRLQTGVVSADFFDAMGVRAQVGRTFRAGEDQPGSDPVLVLSWEYWQRAFGGDPGVAGATLRMNDRTHTVIGVLPRIPQYPDHNDVYMPASSCPFRADASWGESRTARQAAFGLLRPGVSTAAAEQELRRIATALHAEHPDAYPQDRRFDIRAVPLAELMAAQSRLTVLLLFGATAFLLLIVCANVINLAVVRLIRRDQETSTRLALGAGPARIVRQSVVESALLAGGGAVAGVGVAYLASAAAMPVLTQLSTRAHEVSLDGAVLGFALLVTALATLLGGLVPALLRVRRIGSGSYGSRSTSGARHARLRGGLIITQVAVSLVLLAGSGLLIRSLANLERVSAGFDPGRVLTARVDLNWTRYDDAAATARFYRAVEERLHGTPGIEAAAFASSFPLNGSAAARIGIVVDGGDAPADAGSIGVNSVSSRYFAALGIPILRGRAFTDADGATDVPAAIVLTSASARRLFGDDDPIGRRISSDGGQSWGSVIGVAGDMRQQLEGDFEAMAFVHQHRIRDIQSRLLVRGSLNPAQLEQAVRAAVAQVDREQPVTDVRTIREFRDAALAPRRTIALVLGAFAALALLITAVGVAGVIAFAVAEREREISIRIALGATHAGVFVLMVRQAATLTAAGLVLGLALALLATRLLGSLLFNVPAADPLTFLTVAVLLLVVALGAGAAPALRALRTEPVRALR